MEIIRTNGNFRQSSQLSGIRSILFLMGLMVWAIALPLRSQTLAEALDTTNLVWSTGGDSLWFAQTTNTHDGVDAVQSGALVATGTNWIETTVVGPATINYWDFDYTSFLGPFSQFTVIGSINSPVVQQVFESGQWSEKTFDLGAGTNVLRWTVFDYLAVFNGYFCLDQFAVLPPRALAFAEQPGDHSVYSGRMAYFFTDVVGTPPLFYQWKHEGTNVVGGTNAWINLLSATTNDGGVYSVVVSNSQGVITSSNATITVLTVPPFFTSQPENVTGYTGQALTFYLSVGGPLPVFVQWIKDGTNLSWAASSYDGLGIWSPSLTLSNVTLADAGEYSVLVTNQYGSVQSSNFTLNVIQSVAPEITRHPRSLEVAQGVNTWIEADATGTPEPVMWWERVDVPAPPPPPLPPVPQADSSPPVKRYFYNVQSTNAGVYVARASNAAADASSREALLTVVEPITQLGSWTEGARDIFVTNGLAFLAQDTNGLAILSVSNPALPQLLGRCDTPGHAVAVRVAGGLAFVADDAAGVQIISITNPLAPVIVGSYNTPGYAFDIAVRSNLVFVADTVAGMRILSITNPFQPSLVGSLQTNFSPQRICLSGNFAFLTGLNPNGGMQLLNVSEPSQPVEVGRLNFALNALAERSPLIFGVDNSLRSISVSNPAQPLIIGTFSDYPNTNTTPGLGINAKDVQVVNDFVYVLGNYTNLTSLYVLNVRDPSKPVPVGYFTFPGEAHTLWVDGQRVYIAGYDTPLRIIEVPFDMTPSGPPALSFSDDLDLIICGRHGFNYTIESTDDLGKAEWTTLQTFLLTNGSAVISLPAPVGAKFFRAEQLD